MPSRPLVVLWLALVAGGCSEQIAGTLPAPAPNAGSGRFQAGAAKADLTPPPGFPMGGYAFIGKTGRGWWTRLHARVVYLEDAAGEAVAFVACDLWSMPAGLADRVAELLGATPETRHLGRDRLVMAATHTHHSPGNFSTSRVYNAFGSPKHGFDRHLFELLAHRIAGAVVEATRRRRPASVRLATLRVPGVARNRSLPAFLLDPERDAILAENADLPVAPLPGHAAEEYRAVDPTLTVLRLDQVGRSGAPIAVLASFAVHATAMGPASELYSADLFGVAATLVEQRLAGSVVALLNGAEGDVSPDWAAQDRRDTLAVGGRLADAIARGLDTGTTIEPGTIAHRFEPAVPLAGVRFTDADGVVRATADEAMMGAAGAGGAEDGVTPLFAVGWKEGVRGDRLPGQGPKRPLLEPWGLELPGVVDRLLRRFGTPPAGPRTFPAGVYRVGPLVFATLPGEFTTVLGRRIAAAVRDAAGGEPRVVPVGLANEYRSYFTTPEEYEAQQYEGGSTMYGPESGPVVSRALAELARGLGTATPAPAARDYRYDAGPARRFTVADVGATPSLPDDGLADVLEDLATGRPVRGLPCVAWQDRAPSWSDERVTPVVGIETRQHGGGWAGLALAGAEETDDGLDFVTVALGAEGDRVRWASHWMPPAGVPADAEVRFRVWALDGSTRWSPPFGPTARAPRCLPVSSGG